MTVDPRDINTPDEHVLRDPSMLRLTGKHPFNAEPQLKKLEQSGYVTPNQLHFVRNHGPVPQLNLDEHRLEIKGLVNNPIIITMQDILSMPSTTLPVTMVCAGNRRKEQNMVKQSIGFAWGSAGVSTACWTGVYLRDVINQFAGGLQENAFYICFEGSDNTSKGAYGTSVAANRAMSDHYDIMLAYKMNGEDLPLDHGYPLRVIIPGCIGGRSVKWLKTIEASENESQNPFHDNDNKVMPTQVKSPEQATNEGWWKRPEYTLYDLNINSCITTPSHTDFIQLHNLQDTFTARGYAYTGGNRKITRVEVSLDGGKTWLLAHFTRPSADEVASQYGEMKGSNYYKKSRHWCWVLWHIDIEVADLVRAEEMVVRAWDESQNTQPENLTWNLMGMMNNCWFRVKLTLTREPTLSIYCEHPTTVDGKEAPGWMERQLKQESVTNTSSNGPSPPDKSVLTTYTMAEVEKHDSETDCWIIVRDLVYDCTPFLKDHPGGASSILITGGTDCTEEFDAIHSSKAHDMLRDYLIGQVVSNNDEESSIASLSTTVSVSESQKKMPPFLNPKQWKQMVLDTKEYLSPSIRIFRFVFDEATQQQDFGLPIGHHVYLKLPQEQTSRDAPVKTRMRAYTPSRCGPGFVEFLIKIYFPEGNTPGGAFTQLLDKLRVGETIDVKGPLGEYEYQGEGNYSLMRQPSQHTKYICMIAGGTGITPMWQIIDALRHDREPPHVSLIYCVRTIQDLVLSKEIEQVQQMIGPKKFHIRYILSQKPNDEWQQGVGRLNLKELQDHMFPHENDSSNEEKMVLLCGGQAMIDDCCKPLISEIMGKLFASNNIFVF
ncbi:Oxidoreductase, molybdopterin-binding domain-containing protein [Circinella umbellata]|nr:Oxidoreductase, molybdopterin-binding domain-containing protein [Circinella umbellata]